MLFASLIHDRYNPKLIHLGPIHLNGEPWLVKLTTRSMSGRDSHFCNAVRARDQKCVITGRVNTLIPINMWTGLHAAHVFPMEHENIWQQLNYGRWITNMDGDVGVSRMNSTQNGLLMDTTLHGFFDQYLFSINPDVSSLKPRLVLPC